MSNRTWVLGAALLVLAADQLTKAMVVAQIPQYASIPVIEGLLSLNHVRNSGAAFGFLSAAPPGPVRIGLILVSVLAVGLLWAYARDGWHHRGVGIAFGLILGGALGNLSDRLLRHEVVDFVDVYWGRYHWPSFNVADAAITVGAVTLFIGMARHGDPQEDTEAVGELGTSPPPDAAAEKHPARDTTGLH